MFISFRMIRPSISGKKNGWNLVKRSSGCKEWYDNRDILKERYTNRNLDVNINSSPKLSV